MRGSVATRARPSNLGAVTQDRRKQAAYGQLRIAIGGSADLSGAAAAFDAAHSAYVVVQANQQAYAAAVKAINPAVKVGVYKNFGTTKTSTFADGSSAVGVPKGVCDANGWVLKNGSTELYLSAFTNLFAADVASSGYIDQWDATAGAEARSRGFDFVFMDDVNPYLNTQLTSDLYPNDAAYQTAVQTGLARLVPKLRARGLDVIPNVGAWSNTSYITAQDAVADVCGGGTLEQFMTFGYPPTRQARVTINDQINRILRQQRRQGRFWSITHVTDAADTQNARLAIAATLLGIEGSTPAAVALSADANYDGTVPQVTDFAYSPGTPTEDAQQVSTYAWRRTFTGGQVWVNADTSTYAATFGGTYSGSGLTSQTGTTIAAQTGLLLTKD